MDLPFEDVLHESLQALSHESSIELLRSHRDSQASLTRVHQ